MLEPSLCSKKTREYPLSQYYLRLKRNGSDPAQTDYMMQSDQVLICLQFIITIISSQSVTCLVTNAKLTADPGVASSIPARSHTFVEIDHEIISTVILLPSAESFMKGCCQLQAKVCARLLVNCLFKFAQEKSLVRSTDRPAMTIAFDLGRKANKQTNKQTIVS